MDGTNGAPELLNGHHPLKKTVLANTQWKESEDNILTATTVPKTFPVYFGSDAPGGSLLNGNIALALAKLGDGYYTFQQMIIADKGCIFTNRYGSLCNV